MDTSVSTSVSYFTRPGPARTLPAGAARPHAPALVTDAHPPRAAPALAPRAVDAPAPILKEWRAHGRPSTLVSAELGSSYAESDFWFFNGLEKIPKP